MDFPCLQDQYPQFYKNQLIYFISAQLIGLYKTFFINEKMFFFLMKTNSQEGAEKMQQWRGVDTQDKGGDVSVNAGLEEFKIVEAGREFWSLEVMGINVCSVWH